MIGEFTRPLLSAAILAAIGLSVLGGCATEEMAPATSIVDIPVPMAEPMPLPPQESRVLVPAKKEKKVSRRTVKPVTVDAVTEFTYEENRIYQIATSPNYITAIHMKPGEKIGPSWMGQPDKSDWVFNETKAGSPEGIRSVLIIRPMKAGLSSNWFIPTNERTYQLDVKSYENRAMDWVRWRYPDTQRQSISNMVAGPAMAAAGGGTCYASENAFDPASLDRGYSISVTNGEKPRWMPVSAFSYHGKTYIELPARIGQISAPALFISSGGGTMFSPSYRATSQKFYEVDRVFDWGELRQGTTVVRISRVGA